MHFCLEDNLESILDTLKQACLINQKGQTLEIDFSQIRPTGYYTSSGKNETAGPTAFLKLFDSTINIINPTHTPEPLHKAIIKIDHPDIFKFISYQSSGKTNFQIFIIINENFIEAFEKDLDFDLINPSTGNAVNKMHAQSVFELMISSGLTVFSNSAQLSSRIAELSYKIGDKKIKIETGETISPNFSALSKAKGARTNTAGSAQVTLPFSSEEQERTTNHDTAYDHQRKPQSIKRTQEVALPPINMLSEN